jgi:4-alpha-glucanotransferase
LTAPRRAGLLFHPTSLPGGFGIGDLGPEAERFLAWAEEAGATLWQFLPLVPAGAGGSPYGGRSAFAGEPLLVSPERLVEDGLLSKEALGGEPASAADRVDVSAAREKERWLRRAFERFETAGAAPDLRRDFDEFRSSPDQAAWLDDWTLFAALSERFAPAGWIHWPPALAAREKDALAQAAREIARERDFHAFVQFLFHRQWARLRAEARRRGIGLVGDVPIYVSLHSADVWAHRGLFALDAQGRPEAVAGVPPDYFSETGQLWGYPLYRWDRLRDTGYGWWIDRLKRALAQADLVRVDHFRGFAGYWEVPASARTAAEGRWVEGPGRPLFDALGNALGGLPLLAEDLGTITDDVRELLAETGIPGMRVLQFAFSEDDSPHAPHRHVPNAVVYPGTHDNDTARGWFASLGAEERRRTLDYLGGDGSEVSWGLIRAAMESVAERAIVPVQDVFDLGSEARMNLPGKSAGNWIWRARREDFTPDRARRFRRLAELTGRL